MGALKMRLRDDPTDPYVRAELVEAYRRLGHTDQAGRFAIALDGGARPEEVRAYAAMLRRLDADAKTARRLSLMPADLDLPKRVQRAIDGGGPLVRELRRWDRYVAVPRTYVLAASFLTLVATYGLTIAGADNARPIALWGAVATGWVVVVAIVLTTVWCAATSRWRAALIWTCVAAVAGGSTGLATVALVT